MEKDTLASPRPLSPHLQIYRWQLPMTLSILHRMTGVALTVGSLLFVAWLWAAAYSPECFAQIHDFFLTIIGQLLLIGWSFAFYFHLCNGIRHLFWDIGLGFTLTNAYRSGYSVVLVSLALTALTWAIVYGYIGMPL